MGDHFVSNFSAITQLIKNMPHDEDKRGRLRDHLAILLEGAEARLRALELNQELGQVVKESNQALTDIQGMQMAQKERAMQIMDEVMKNLQESFMSYGLTEEQENSLLQVVQLGIDQSLNNFEQGLKIDERLHAIVHRLEHFTQG